MPIYLLLLLLTLAACAPVAGGETPEAGWLRPCPASPNCLFSLADDEKHAVAPLRCQLPAPAALALLAETVSALPGGRVVLIEGNYLRAEFVSRVFHFVDDVEFVVDESRGRIDLRSASRVGYSDFGANRRRVEKIREAFKSRLEAVGR